MATTAESHQRTQTADTVLELRRTFRKPPAAVFHAWTMPEAIAAWWGPRDFTARIVELDVRPGGRWRTCMISPDGVEHWASGVYVEVVQDQRLEFTWAWETDGVRGHETSVVIEFTPCSDGTELQLTHQVFESLESRDAHSGGWSSCLDSLGDTLSELA